MNTENNDMKSVSFTELLEKWDSAFIDLNRSNGLFRFDNVRLRNCSLHFTESFNEYFIRYKDVTFGLHDIFNIR